MNTETFALTLGPCADREFELVDMHEGSLDPQHVGAVRRHVEGCTRCRDYLSALVELDVALVTELPRPELSPGFDARLRARITELQQVPDRLAALAAAEREHELMLSGLGRGFGWRTVLNAVALASSAGGVILGLESFAPGVLDALGLVPPGWTQAQVFSFVLSVVFFAGGALYARRPGSGPSLLAG